MACTHFTREIWENGGFTLKMHQCFRSTLRWENLKLQQPPIILDLCLRKTKARKSLEHRDTTVSKCLPSTQERKAGVCVLFFFQLWRAFSYPGYRFVWTCSKPNGRYKARVQTFLWRSLNGAQISVEVVLYATMASSE